MEEENKKQEKAPANPPAFPNTQTKGMSLRDHFAGQALTGMIAQLSWVPSSQQMFDEIADRAYNMADAMLKRREQ